MCPSCCWRAARSGSTSWRCARPCGAARGQIVRQLLTESLAIAVAGGALGVFDSPGGASVFMAAWLPSSSFPAESVIEMNVPVLLFSLGLAAATAVAFGISPALQLSRPDMGRGHAGQHAAS